MFSPANRMFARTRSLPNLAPDSGFRPARRKARRVARRAEEAQEDLRFALRVLEGEFDGVATDEEPDC